jgi:hypothetical protein
MNTTMRGLTVLLVAAWTFQAVAANTASPGAAMEGAWLVSPSRLTLEPADGSAIAFTAEGRKLYEANKAAAAKGDYQFDNTTSYCSSPGVPRLMIAPKLIKLLIRPNVTTFLFEWNGLFRPIDMSGKRREPPEIGKRVFGNRAQQDLLFGTMQGKSYGRWEKDVLVIESEGFSDQKLLDNVLPNSEELKLVERIRLLDRNTLQDRITITDPTMYEKPWEAVVTYKRQQDRAFEEYVCLDHKRAGEAVWVH